MDIELDELDEEDLAVESLVVCVATPPLFMCNLCPILKIELGLSPFQRCMSLTFALYLCAIPPRVSPFFTVCVNELVDAASLLSFNLLYTIGLKYTLSLYV